MTAALPLARQVVVVAGASSGMGRATARLAFAAGADLALLARRGGDLSREAAALAPTRPGGRIETLALDATDAAAVTAALGEVMARFGRMDALVNSVGTNIVRRALDELTPQSWREMVATNLDAAFHLTHAAVPILRAAGGGLIVHIASVAGRVPDKSGAAYQATKAGVVALAHAVMEEERGNGLRVTAILPGMTDTPLLEKRPTPPTEEMRRIALQPEDVASACLLVLSLPPRAHVPELVLQPARR